MKRTDFVTAYAERSGLDPRWAALGIIDVDGTTMFALPCGCGEANCEGWAMVTGNTALDHLFLHAPEKLRDAYHEAVATAEKA